MKDISLMDILYTGGMLFLAFYGAVVITKLLSKLTDSKTAKEEEGEKKEEK